MENTVSNEGEGNKVSSEVPLDDPSNSVSDSLSKTSGDGKVPSSGLPTFSTVPSTSVFYNPSYYPLHHCGYAAFPYFYAPYMTQEATPMPTMLPECVPLRPTHLPPNYDYSFDQSASASSRVPLEYGFLYNRQLSASSDSVDKRAEARPSDVNSDGGVKVCARISKGRLRWTLEMDALLKEGVELYGKSGVGMWKKVADYVNAGINYTFIDELGQPVDFVITNHQCGERYKHHIDPSLNVKKKGPWAEEEVAMLTELVEQYQSKDEGMTDHGRSKTQVNWLEVSARLNRNYRDCQHKWINLSKAALKNGPFTPVEEEVILKRVEELGEKSHGLWSKLEKELGRRSRSIQDKYSRMAKKKKV
eukprot:gene3294-3613_t